MRIRHLSGVVATLVVAPALTVLPAQPPSADADGKPVATSERRVDLVDPATVASAATGDADQTSTADVTLAKQQAARNVAEAKAPAEATTAEAQKVAPVDPAAMPEPEVLEVSTPQNVPSEVAVAGVTYGSKPAPGTVIQYRTKPAGAGDWAGWEAIDSDSVSATADGSGDGGSGDASGGSDPIVLTQVSQVQVRVLGPAGSPTTDAKLTVIDPGKAAQDAGVGAPQPGAAHAAAAMPSIFRRAQWGADESWRKGPPSYTQVRGVIVHHTAGTNNYTQAQVPAILRGIYAFHTRDRGWNDIAYNVMVDKWGRMWEGRAGGLDRGVQGAHASGWNTNTMGVSVLGDYQAVTVSRAAVDSVARVIAWKAGVHGFAPDGHATINGRWVPTIQGHRDVGNTTCPGRSLQAQLPYIRTTAARLAGSRTSTTPVPTAPAPVVGGSAGLRANDVLMRNSANALFRSSPLGNTGLSFAARVSDVNWSQYDKVMAVGDMTGDGIGDVLARTASGGRLHLYPGTRDGRLGGVRDLGSGWGGMNHLSGGVDFNGDGRNDLVAVIARTGELYVYLGNGRGGFSARRSLGTGWGQMRDVISLGDWDGDGRADIMGVLRSGTAFVYPTNGRAAWRGGRTQIATNFSQWPTVVGLPGSRAVFGVTSGGDGVMVRRYGLSTVRASQVAPNFRGLHVYGG